MKSHGKGASGRELFLAFLTAAVSFTGAELLWQDWFRTPYARNEAIYPQWTVANLWTSALAFFVSPVFLTSLLVAISLSITKSCTSLCLKVSVLGFAAVAFALLAVAGAILSGELLHCGIFFCANAEPVKSDWWPSFGLMLLAPMLIGTGAFLWATLKAVGSPDPYVLDAEDKDCWASDDDGSATDVSGSSSTTTSSVGNMNVGVSWRRLTRKGEHLRIVSSVLLSVIILPALFLLCSVLPNGFEHFSPDRLAKHMATESGKPELPGAIFHTVDVRSSENLVWKFYPDNYFFYGFLEILALGSLAASLSPRLRRRLSRQVTTFATLGEILASLLFGVFLVFWFIYWLHDHNYHGGKNPKLNLPTERAGRTFGLTSSMFMGLALLPASKNSLWFRALGISWEHGVAAHRLMGIAAVLFMIMHIVSFWVRYSELGTLSHDIIRIPVYYMSGPEAQMPYSNWTVNWAMIAAFPSIICFGIFATLLRDRSWELFKYTHYIFLVLIPVVLFHGASAWYFMIAGIAFWLIDAAIRVACSTSQRVRVLGARAHHVESGVIELKLNVAPRLCGQFAWINVPAISGLEWHPFSIASAPQDKRMRFMIKAMGSGTWTQRLMTLAKERGRDFAIQLDGPYGEAPDVRGHQTLLLLAGGIGITGVLSTFRTVACCVCHSTKGLGTLKTVSLVWVIRSREMFDLAAPHIVDCLDLVREAGPGTEFNVQVFVTGKGTTIEDSAGVVAFQSGRPEWSSVYGKHCSSLGAYGSMLVQACGPPAFVDASQAAAFAFNAAAAAKKSKKKNKKNVGMEDGEKEAEHAQPPIVFESKAFRL
mmetsp:Transcript_54276/g.115817  ORF Transcript_54276/g.115817 Transcript_54276/m.115817 type:complete len:821 (+) Transcript_54276:266-2728(+)